MSLLTFLLQVNINEKIKTAPDNSYQIGVWIGSILPFAVIVGIAYWMYYRAKKRQNDQ